MRALASARTFGRREDGWEHPPFDPHVSWGRIVGRGACDMKGGIAAMVVAAEVLAGTGALRGDLVVCTNTDEESSGVGGPAWARRGITGDYTIVTEPSSLEVRPACRGTVYCTIDVAGPQLPAHYLLPDRCALFDSC